MYPATRLNLMVILHVDILQGERIMTVMKYKTGSTIAINNLGISRLSFLLHYLYSVHQHRDCGCSHESGYFFVRAQKTLIPSETLSSRVD